MAIGSLESGHPAAAATLASRRRDDPWQAIGLLLLLALVLLLFPGLIVDAPPALAVWCAVACTVALAVLGYRRSLGAGENPWVSPLLANVVFVFVLQYGVGLAFVQYGELAVDYTDWDPLGFLELREIVTSASQLIIVAALGTYAGLLVPTSRITRLLPPLVWKEDARRFPFRAFLLYPLIFAAFAYSISDQALGEIQQTAYIIGMFGLVLVVSGFVHLQQGTRHPYVWRTVVAGAALAYVAIGLLFGSRGAMLLIAIFYLWSVLGVKRKMSRQLLAATAIGLMFFSVFVFPWLSLYKYHRKGGLVPVRDAVVWSTEDYYDSFGELKVVGLLEFIRSLTFQATYVANYRMTTPDPNPFLWGESATVILSTIVPRVLNPGKVNAVEYLQELAYGAGLFTDATFSGTEQRGAISIDFVSEFYINFGPWGVLVLSILQGIYLRVRYEWLVLRSTFALGFPVYAVGFISASSFWQTFVLDIKNWAIWIPLLWFCSRRFGK